MPTAFACAGSHHGDLPCSQQETSRLFSGDRQICQYWPTLWKLSEEQRGIVGRPDCRHRAAIARIGTTGGIHPNSPTARLHGSAPVSFRFAAGQTRLRNIRVFGGILRARDLLVFSAAGRSACHAMAHSHGGERGCAGQQFENATPGTGNCCYLSAGAAFLCSTKVCA